jgi:hypothetical protein
MAALQNQEGNKNPEKNPASYKKKSYHYHLSRLCSRESPSPSSNGVHVTGPPTSRGSLIINEQNTALSEEKKYEDFNFHSGRPGMLHIISKLFPCFSCCQKRNAQIVQETNKCGNYSENFGYDNKQVIENRLENLGEISSSDHMERKKSQIRHHLDGAGIGGNETDEFMFNSQ